MSASSFVTAMTDWQRMMRAICSHMTREQAAERLDCSRSTIDKYLIPGHTQQPYAALADRIRALHAELEQTA